MGGLEASLANTIFFSIAKAKAHWKKYWHVAWKIECKKTRINDLSIVYRGKDGHIP